MDEDPYAPLRDLSKTLGTLNDTLLSGQKQTQQNHTELVSHLSDLAKATRQNSEDIGKLVAITGEMAHGIDRLTAKVEGLERKVDGLQIGAGSSAPLALPASTTGSFPALPPGSSVNYYLTELTARQDTWDQATHWGEKPEKRMERLALQGFRPHRPI